MIPSILAFFFAWLFTALVRRYSSSCKLVHQPNHRSSHSDITPHGGGLGIVASCLLISLWLVWNDDFHYSSFWGVVGLFLLVAVVGLVDDILHLPVTLRLSVHASVCLVLFLGLSRLPLPDIPNILIFPFAITVALVVFAGTWWINLFNFMDGIDGIAATQAIFMLGAAAILSASFYSEASETSVWLWMVCLATATLGFLVHNWAPAKIFMGDVGSTFLAFMILFFALMTLSIGWLNYQAWAILAAIFVVDATITLIRRIVTGQNFLEAHRTHAYQILARRWQSHAKVTLLVIAINVLYLFPLAWLCSYYPLESWWWLGIAYIPLIIAIYKLGAGKAELAT